MAQSHREHSLQDLENRLHPSERMPVLFVGHGTPMNAIESNTYSRTWSTLGKRLPVAQAIVVISAHWLTRGSTHITDAPTNPIIYDFQGFPEELYQVQYETRGDDRVARLLLNAMRDYEASLDAQWGLDHGTWSVLRWLAPAPTVPVLQISIDYSMPLPQLYELFGRLRRLRDRGVIFIGSSRMRV
ncbi:MAG: dioxygenase [Microbacteriaceae bacterium]|jgi:4,5-DOPA dioxygenase extradiol|nr:dioxygenase [Microbacteriaceae bacterium]MCI1207601.1 dioxygenase [Microbacteriaceae bacterium]